MYGRRKETLNRKRWNHNPLFLELLDFYTLSLFYDGCWRETAHGRHAYPLPAPHWPKIKWNKQTNKKPKNTQTKGHRTSSTKQRLLSVAVAKLRSDVMKLWDWGSKERVFLSLQVFPSCDSSLVSSELVFSQDAGCVFTHHAVWMGSPSGAVAKNPLANAGDSGDAGSIHGSGRSPGEGTGKRPQYSCLKSSMDRGAWWATVHGVAQSQTWLSTHTGQLIYGAKDPADLLPKQNGSIQLMPNDC